MRVPAAAMENVHHYLFICFSCFVIADETSVSSTYPPASTEARTTFASRWLLFNLDNGQSFLSFFEPWKKSKQLRGANAPFFMMNVFTLFTVIGETAGAAEKACCSCASTSMASYFLSLAPSSCASLPSSFFSLSS